MPDVKEKTFLQASSEGYVEVFSKLLEESKGALLTSSDGNQNTCLHLAASNGHHSIVDTITIYIQKHGKDGLVIDVNALNIAGKTPLDLANESEKNVQGKSAVVGIRNLASAIRQPALTSESLKEMRAITQSIGLKGISVQGLSEKFSNQQNKTQDSKKLPAFEKL